MAWKWAACYLVLAAVVCLLGTAEGAETAALRQAPEVPPKIDISKLPYTEKVKLSEEASRQARWGRNKKKEIEAWERRQKAILARVKERKEKEFGEAVRRMHCAMLKRKLLEKTAMVIKIAKKTHKRRTELAEKKKATERAKEILQKVNSVGKTKSELASTLLGNARVSTGANPADAKYWVKALNTADPSWQAENAHKYRNLKYTHPNSWRKQQNQAQGDGGASWRRQTTRYGTPYDRNPSMDLTELSPIDEDSDLLELSESPAQAVAKLGEAQLKKLGETTKVQSAEEKLGVTKMQERVDEDETAQLRRAAELKDFVSAEKLKIEKVKNVQEKKVKKWTRGQNTNMKKLVAEKNHGMMCMRSRNTMSAHIAHAVINLPLLDIEKTQQGKPLWKDMEAWLHCRRCKKPKVVTPPGQMPKPWP